MLATHGTAAIFNYRRQYLQVDMWGLMDTCLIVEPNWNTGKKEKSVTG